MNVYMLHICVMYTGYLGYCYMGLLRWQNYKSNFKESVSTRHT